MNHRWILISLAPVLASCSQTYAVRFQPRAFPTRPGQKVVITTARGRTEIRGVAGSRDIQVEGAKVKGARVHCRAAELRPPPEP